MYPTRENMQRSADYYADYGELKPRYVAWMLAMYDALDAKQAELDGRTKALDWTVDRCDELALEAGQTKIELDKAHDIIRRVMENDKNQGTMEFPLWWNELNSIMEEAEALLNEKQAQT